MQNRKEKNTAIVLAAGQGKRMNTSVQKQYLVMEGKPILSYSLQVFEESFVDEVILVVEEGWQEYCREQIVEKYGFCKVKNIISGGKERYDSVFCGLQVIDTCDYVYIHDGARPFVTQEILERARDKVYTTKSCVVGMPVKDTIKIADSDGYVESTPPRERMWQIQTPQVFSFPIIKEAYTKLMEQSVSGVTDDAMVVETMLGQKVSLVEGSYENIKITTPEDLLMGKAIIQHFMK